MRGFVHRTWANTYASRPILYYKPQNEDELLLIVQNAHRNLQTITVIGSAHSPSTLTMSTSVLVNLDLMNRVLSYDLGHGYTDVRVQAGIRLFQLNEILAEKGLALQNLGSISDQSVAGVISTGTHGSSAYHGLISEQIVNLKLMLASGKIIECSDSENSDVFKAALLSLGKFGVIIEATIRTVHAFNLDCLQEVVDFDDFLDTWWPKFFISAEFHRVWWYPYSRKCVVWTANRTESDKTPTVKGFAQTRWGRFLYQLLLWASVVVYPRWTPAVERWLFTRQFKPVVREISRSDKALNMDCYFKQFVDEWSLPLTNGLEVIREMDAKISEREFFVHAPIEIRVSNTTLPSEQLSTRHGAVVADVPNIGPIYGNISRPYLDPSPKLPYAHPPDITYDNLTLNLNVTMYRPFGFNSQTRDWFSAFEDICERNGGKPHWAKNFLGANPSKAKDHHMRGIKPQVHEWYGKDLEEWKELRRKFDPSDVFVGNKRWMEINGLL